LKRLIIDCENFYTATGEPPLCMSCVIPIAIRNALNSARAETGNTDEWYRLGKFEAKI